MNPKKGFTLAELLIALGILGLIAAFTIPKVLDAGANSQKKAVFKQTIATLNQIAVLATAEGDIDGSTFPAYFLSKVNAVQICPNDSEAEGCWTAPSNTGLYGSDKEGAILHNGAVLTLHDLSTSMTPVFIDWNGPDGPNLEAEDQMCVPVCFIAAGCEHGNTHGASWGNANSKYGEVGHPANDSFCGSTASDNIDNYLSLWE